MRVYLDHHAATPTSPRVLAAMRDAREGAWANPSSVHAEGRASRARLERAREQIAAAVSAASADIVLTAGGTEACNLAVLGGLGAETTGHIITSEVEHPAIAEPIRRAEARGLRVTRLRMLEGKPPEPSQLMAAITKDTRLFAFNWLNHETGTLAPIEAYVACCRERGVRSCIDATQAFGKVPIDLKSLGADLVAFASHKIGGPAGAGALFVRRGLDLEGLSIGGGQERGRRAGTPDVIAQVGFGEACSIATERLAAQPSIAWLRDRLEAALIELGARRNAGAGPRSSTASNLYFPDRRADALVAALDVEGVAVSAGAACSSGKSEPSPVILAMHPDEPARASASIRLSFGPEINEIDVDFALNAFARVLARPGA
ncbi:MAG TPA: cysteine desulfurase family protein [Polyangiales bacterium]|nr:cysteine desulfurase family protein [Polyangiales bacterium]